MTNQEFKKYIEENKIPTINHNLLLKEIEEVRKKYNIIEIYDKYVMEEYRKELEKQKNNITI